MSTPDDTQLSEEQKRFTDMYLSGDARWDTGISPPELTEAIQSLPAGVALDIGCGTGTNCIYMAEHGWNVTGIDFAQPAIDIAQTKIAKSSVSIAAAGGKAHVYQADVTQIAEPEQRAQLLLDIGCLNGIPFDKRQGYAQTAQNYAAPGALFLLYTHMPDPQFPGRPGCVPDEIDELFGQNFTVERREFGADHGAGSFWTWLRRKG